MKAVPKINANGLYMEDELVDDAFSGIVPFYSNNSRQDGEKADQDSIGEPQEPEVAGYTIGYPVTPGLYHPRFDIQRWNADQEKYSQELAEAKDTHEQQEATALANVQQQYAVWKDALENERGPEPVYTAQSFIPPVQLDPTAYWTEGLSEEEIAELTRSHQTEPSETDQLKQRLADLEIAIAKLLVK